MSSSSSSGKKEGNSILSGLVSYGIYFLIFVCWFRSCVTDDYQSAIPFSDKDQTISLPSGISYADSRRITDANADGIPDIVETYDWYRFIPLLQDWNVRVFLGSRSQNGKISFSNYAETIPLGDRLHHGWITDDVINSVDAPDANGDGKPDIIITQLFDGLLWDNVRMVQGTLNLGKHEVTISNQEIMYDGKPLSDYVEAFISHADAWYWFWLDWVYSLESQMIIKWEDMDGNGTDDLVLGWDTGFDLEATIFYTARTHDGSIEVVRHRDFELPWFMAIRSAQSTVVGDVTGDGKGDIIAYRTGMFLSDTELSVAKGVGSELEPDFVLHEDITVDDTDMNFFRFESYKTMDIDGDGKDDFVHFGVYSWIPLGSGDKTVGYNLSK